MGNKKGPRCSGPANYHSAQRQLVRPYTFIVTNIRLAEYNGLQLVCLAHDAHPDCRAIAYTDERDAWLATKRNGRARFTRRATAYL
jgi:hypothetical protein